MEDVEVAAGSRKECAISKSGLKSTDLLLVQELGGEFVPCSVALSTDNGRRGLQCSTVYVFGEAMREVCTRSTAANQVRSKAW